jgi:hypothetical protein
LKITNLIFNKKIIYKKILTTKLTLSSLFPCNKRGFKTGQNFFISLIQFGKVVLGAITR